MAGNLITDRVKQIVRMRGPLIPSQVSKEIGTNILMASAILSELSSHNEVKISSVKVGGTPLYYVAGQEEKLQNYIAGLHQKEKEAFEKLKTSGVLRDSALDPVTRVALRGIKDFAKPLEVSIDGQAEIFWKWYLLPNEDAEVGIKKMMGFKDEMLSEPQQQAQQLKHELPTPTATQVQETLLQPAVPAVPQAASTKTRRPAKTGAPSAVSAEFERAVNDFLTQNTIEVLPGTDSEKGDGFVVLLPSPVGKLKYYCIAKNKKTCTDTDISSALVQGQLKKLPALLLTRGELSKKAQELLLKEVGAIVIKKI